MTKEKYISKLVQIAEQQISNVLSLVSEGATVPFMARYRKERTGGLDEVQIQKIIDASDGYSQIIKRKESILKSIEEQGTEEKIDYSDGGETEESAGTELTSSTSFGKKDVQ